MSRLLIAVLFGLLVAGCNSTADLSDEPVGNPAPTESVESPFHPGIYVGEYTVTFSQGGSRLVQDSLTETGTMSLLIGDSGLPVGDDGSERLPGYEYMYTRGDMVLESTLTSVTVTSDGVIFVYEVSTTINDRFGLVIPLVGTRRITYTTTADGGIHLLATMSLNHEDNAGYAQRVIEDSAYLYREAATDDDHEPDDEAEDVNEPIDSPTDEPDDEADDIHEPTDSPPDGPDDSEDAEIHSIEEIQASTWLVVAESRDFAVYATAFGVGPSLLATNAHVVEGIEGIMSEPEGVAIVVQHETGEFRTITRTWIHPDYDGTSIMIKTPDVGLLETDQEIPDYLELPEADTYPDLHVLDDVSLCGFPGSVTAGIDLLGALTGEFRPRVSCLTGKISALRPFDPGVAATSENSLLIQHDISTEGGVSGSAVFDSSGQIVGVHAWGYSLEAENNIAMRIDTLTELLDDVSRGLLPGTHLEDIPQVTGGLLLDCRPVCDTTGFCDSDCDGTEDWLELALDTDPCIPSLSAPAPDVPCGSDLPPFTGAEPLDGQWVLRLWDGEDWVYMRFAEGVLVYCDPLSPRSFDSQGNLLDSPAEVVSDGYSITLSYSWSLDTIATYNESIIGQYVHDSLIEVAFTTSSVEIGPYEFWGVLVQEPF